MMRAWPQLMAGFGGLLLSLLLASCGGSDGGAFTGSSTSGTGSGTGTGTGTGGSTAGANVATASVTTGATNNSINTLFVSVTVCLPGSSTCQTIDNIQVDTGSTGLRILASALNLALPTQTASSGGALLECLNFVDGYIWGPVALADVQVGGESASSVPVQVIGDSRYPNVPTDCPNTGATEEDTVDTFGANGILGVGPFQYDCQSTNSSYQGCDQAVIPAAYYGCTGAAASSCTASEAALTQQVQSVVAKFASDNNGVIIDLPAVPDPVVGAATLTGSLIFGIDTQTNNASGTETVLTTDDEGDITVSFNGQTLNQSFLDSGTNGIYFNNTSLPACTQADLTYFYCPTAPTALTATLLGQNGVSDPVSFSIANANTMLNTNPTYSVFPELGGTYSQSGGGTTSTFDFGLPFFYGRRVAVAMQGAVTSAGTGPYYAF